MKFKVGDRVKAPHGTGTVIGFETFDSQGNNCQLSLVPGTYQDDVLPVSKQRIALLLDPGNSWNFKFKAYYCYEKELEEI